MNLSASEIERLRDPMYRLCNLYDCRREGKPKAGESAAIPFGPRAEQLVIFKHLIETPLSPVYIVKSRRLGMSTGIGTFMADSAWNNRGFTGMIVDQTEDDAVKKMSNIVRFAVDSLPYEIKDDLVFDKRNDGELKIRTKSEDENKASVIYAGTKGRGGDCSMLHVSEWGPIAATDPTRSREIRTGTLPAARAGMRVVETTWYGGKSGDLWELVDPIIRRDPNAEGVIYFFPWHSDPAAIKIDGLVTKEVEQYFRELAEKTSKTFSQEQKKWYASKQLEQGIFIKREYPSTLDEAFSAPVEGSVYGDIIKTLRASSRICAYEYDHSCPVFSSWDLGWNDSTTVWFWQIVGRDFHWIWHTRQETKTAAEMAHIIDQTGIAVTGHFLPHDAANKNAATGLNYKMALEKAGMVNVSVVPRTTDIWAGINSLRDILKRSWFRSPQCEEGIASLEAYHTKPAGVGGIVSKEPVHDISSHDCDACRTAAEAIELGMVRGAAAKRLNAPPRFPDGSMVNVDQIKEGRQRRRRSMALSGPSL